MGFEEHGQSSMRNNRSLLRRTLQKYFRGEKGIAVNENTDLDPRRIKQANEKKLHIETGYIIYLITGAIFIFLVFLLLQECA